MADFYWHEYHDALLSWCADYDKRRETILWQKVDEEHALRLRLFRPVQGELPAAVMATCRAESEAGQVYHQAEEAVHQYDGVFDDHVRLQVRLEEKDNRLQALTKASAAWSDARIACIQAQRAHLKEVDALHKMECPDCPWDGSTIFPNRSIATWVCQAIAEG